MCQSGTVSAPELHIQSVEKTSADTVLVTLMDGETILLTLDNILSMGIERYRLPQGKDDTVHANRNIKEPSGGR